MARPPLITYRLSRTDDGRIVYRLKNRWCDGSTHVVSDLLTFLARLAALVPAAALFARQARATWCPTSWFRMFHSDGTECRST